MGTLWQDVRFAVRMLRANPGFTAVAVLTLALGIGANTSLFSVVKGVLLDPLPYPQPDRLVALYEQPASTREEISFTYPDFLDCQRDNHAFESMAGYYEDDFNLSGTARPERLRGDRVSAQFFPVLGVKPVVGRLFREDDDRLGAQPVALISAGFWARKFGSSPGITGTTIMLDGADYAIVGVIPASFRFNRSNDVYIPLGQWSDQSFRDRGNHWGTLGLARLKPGVTLAEARADMDRVAQNLAAAYPETDRDEGIAVVPLKKDIVGDVQSFLLVLLGAVGFVLLIACANVANLLLVRSTARKHEFAIRAALGATQGRVARQLLTESVILALMGGGLGLLLAVWATQAALRVAPQALPRAENIGLDSHVLFFTLVISVLTGILFGLAPVIKTSRPNLQETLKEGGRGSSEARHRVQSVLVAAEIALALVLLIGSGLMIRSLARLSSVNPGFNPRNVLTFNLTLPASVSSNPDGIRAYFRELHDKFGAIPGLEASSVFAGSLPMKGDAAFPFWLEGQPKPATYNDMSIALWYAVEPEYFRAMQVPLERGRLLTSQDNEHSPFVVVIDDAFARKYFGNRDPVGKRINLAFGYPQAEIVGVVGHVKHSGLDSDGRETIQAQFYFPFVQMHDRELTSEARGVTVVIRTHRAPLALVGSIRRTIEQMNSEQVIYNEETMDDIVSNSLAARRFSMILLSVFAALALLLASVGIYGVIACLVGQRTHEIGIRTALGARPEDVLRLVLAQGARIVLVGVAIGLAAAFGLTRVMTRLLYGVGATDPLTLTFVAALLTLIALLACYIPARRAMRVDPIVALRCD